MQYITHKTIWRSLNLDRRQAVPKVIGVAEVRRFTEYDVINSDFSTDDEPVHIMPVVRKLKIDLLILNYFNHF